MKPQYLNDVQFELSQKFDQRYQVKNKSITNLPAIVPEDRDHPDKGKKITWITSYGFELKPNVEKVGDIVDAEGYIMNAFPENYTVRLSKKGNTVWCWDGKELTDLDYTTLTEGQITYAVVKLKKTDPALGMT